MSRTAASSRQHASTSLPAHVWRKALTGLCTAVPPTENGTDYRIHIDPAAAAPAWSLGELALTWN